jgi:hypothetical protein
MGYGKSDVWTHLLPEKLWGGRPAPVSLFCQASYCPIYDLMRAQRNELGHLRETRPQVSREDVFVNLQIFPRYYETVEELRLFFSIHCVRRGPRRHGRSLART